MKTRLLSELLKQKEIKLKGQIYHLTQVEMAYNSNRIEGSRLSEDQTRFLFETRTLYSVTEPLKTDDIFETINHFRLFDYMLETADEALSPQLLKEYHKILKQNTSDVEAGYPIGEYKKYPNTVGNIITTDIGEVSDEMDNLLLSYETGSKDIANIARFHLQFETIHPFQDGNGRVGRMIIFKECLRHDITPALILDRNKEEYYDCLKVGYTEPERLKVFFSKMQEEYENKINYFLKGMDLPPIEKTEREPTDSPEEPKQTIAYNPQTPRK